MSENTSDTSSSPTARRRKPSALEFGFAGEVTRKRSGSPDSPPPAPSPKQAVLSPASSAPEAEPSASGSVALADAPPPPSSRVLVPAVPDESPSDPPLARRRMSEASESDAPDASTKSTPQSAAAPAPEQAPALSNEPSKLASEAASLPVPKVAPIAQRANEARSHQIAVELAKPPAPLPPPGAAATPSAAHIAPAPSSTESIAPSATLPPAGKAPSDASASKSDASHSARPSAPAAVAAAAAVQLPSQAPSTSAPSTATRPAGPEAPPSKSAVAATESRPATQAEVPAAARKTPRIAPSIIAHPINQPPRRPSTPLAPPAPPPQGSVSRVDQPRTIHRSVETPGALHVAAPAIVPVASAGAQSKAPDSAAKRPTGPIQLPPRPTMPASPATAAASGASRAASLASVPPAPAETASPSDRVANPRPAPTEPQDPTRSERRRIPGLSPVQGTGRNASPERAETAPPTEPARSIAPTHDAAKPAEPKPDANPRPAAPERRSLDTAREALKATVPPRRDRPPETEADRAPRTRATSTALTPALFPKRFTGESQSTDESDTSRRAAPGRSATSGEPTPMAASSPVLDYQNSVDRQVREQRAVGSLLSFLVYGVLLLLVIGGSFAAYGAYVFSKELAQQKVTTDSMRRDVMAHIATLRTDTDVHRTELRNLQGGLSRESKRAAAAEQTLTEANAVQDRRMAGLQKELLSERERAIALGAELETARKQLATLSELAATTETRLRALSSENDQLRSSIQQAAAEAARARRTATEAAAAAEQASEAPAPAESLISRRRSRRR